MTEEAKIALIEETIGLDTGVLKAETELATVEMWDSVGKLMFMSMMKKEFGKDMEPSQVRSFARVSDIMAEMR